MRAYRTNSGEVLYPRSIPGRDGEVLEAFSLGDPRTDPQAAAWLLDAHHAPPHLERLAEDMRTRRASQKA